MATSWQRDGGEEWGPWVIHDGKGCPVRPGTIVEVVCEDRFGFAMRQVSLVEGGSYSSWDWSHYPELKRIIRYREKKPKGLKLLESQIVTLDVKVPGSPVGA
ncbi:MAG: hypothetical protein WBB85_04900 [Albidovulum sp.]|uniref:hypothetical protein n=1 Tax=Albidovulum sp. TaxID=1872424 RepID=UPI003CB7732F